MLTFSLLFLITYLTFASTEPCSNTNNLVRVTEHGLIRGKVVTSAFNNTTQFYSFRPVPYAKPPVGNLRFRPPQPAAKWLGIKDATTNMTECSQISNKTEGHDVDGSEDCLYLEIFEAITAREKEKECGLLPVMVWIHGGAFIFANPSETGPEFFMEKPIVLVGIQYRLDVLGFLSTKDSAAEGNYGLKDQLFALKWVKRNIRYFGGDPNSVTIFGESAGGSSVAFHMLSPKSRGYFHRGISQSGVALNRWAHRPNPRQIAFRLGKGLGIETQDSHLLVERLRQTDVKSLLLTGANESVVGFYTTYYALPFNPSLERESPEAFITERMYQSLKQGKYNRVPYLLGYNTEEGSDGWTYIDNGRVNISIYDEYPELIIPISMNVKNGSQCAEKVINDVDSFYFDNKTFTDRDHWIPYISQDCFQRGIWKTVDFVYKDVPVYIYKFSYIGQYTAGFIGGVGHYGEMGYMWYGTGMFPPITRPKDLEIRNRMVTLWTNFARTGNPTPVKDAVLQNITWPKVDDSRPCLSIDNDLSIIYDPNKANNDFWKKEFDECGNPPYTTY